MSDFLIQLGRETKPQSLIRLTQMPYTHRRPVGEAFVFPWGSVVALEERFGKSAFSLNGTLVAWVGDLVANVSEKFLESLVRCIATIRSDARGEAARDLRSDPVLAQLNGSFSFVIADAAGFNVITDPMNYVQVYMATDERGKIASVGTHPDLVAKTGGQDSALDLTSLGEFLNAGTPLFPNTVYRNVKELHPGSVYTVSISNDAQRMSRGVYWSPPEEQRHGCNETAMAEELREILLAVVRARCQVGKAGVFLSGGLDSRLIMAAVPKTVQCIGLTFSNHPNRETRTAKRVAACYGRQWILLTRQPEFLADCLVDSVKLTGCEYEWTCGQVAAFAKDLENLNLDVILEGTLFNDYFTAFCAREWQLQKRWGGLLPSQYRKNNWNYVEQISNVWRANLTGEVLALMRQRRQKTYDLFADPHRGSVAEWMEIYPFTQDPSIGYFPVERRVLPVRLVAMDRRALDFSFRCPIELKLGSRLYLQAICAIYGKGKRIPNANDGVRPGSSHWSRLVQRGVHELKRRTARLSFQWLGMTRVPHSWHNYPRYWRESPRLKHLCQAYGPNLDEFDGSLIQGRGRDVLARPDLHWEYGFRLLQLGVWRDVTRSYRV